MFFIVKLRSFYLFIEINLKIILLSKKLSNLFFIFVVCLYYKLKLSKIKFNNKIFRLYIYCSSNNIVNLICILVSRFLFFR